METCQLCRFPHECAFGACFDAAAENGGSQAAPYVLNVPLTRQQLFRTGDTLDMSIALVGWARKWTPWIVAALERMGQRGMGWGHAPWKLIGVAAEGPVGKLSMASGNGQRCAELSGSEIVSVRPLADCVTVEFLTPTQLKDRKDGSRFAEAVTGELLVRRAGRFAGTVLRLVQ